MRSYGKGLALHRVQSRSAAHVPCSLPWKPAQIWGERDPPGPAHLIRTDTASLETTGSYRYCLLRLAIGVCKVTVKSFCHMNSAQRRPSCYYYFIIIIISVIHGCNSICSSCEFRASLSHPFPVSLSLSLSPSYWCLGASGAPLGKRQAWGQIWPEVPWRLR